MSTPRESDRVDGAALSAEDVSFAVGLAQLLEAVSLEVRPGTLLGLIGPNGAGKSTLLKCISQLLAPSTGRVSLDGEDLRGQPPQEIARHIALLPQSTTLNFAFTCLEVVLMGRNPHLGRFQAEGARDHAIAQQSMTDTGSAEFVTRLITEVSAGERQRVLLARALTQQPRLLLLDEPTAGLDVQHQLQVFSLIRDLVGQGLTAIAVVHDLNLAARYCDRLVLLDRGAVRARGCVDDVLTPQNLADVFNVEATVDPDPALGVPRVTVIKALEGAQAPTDGEAPATGDHAIPSLARD
ncbi:MAG: heme ABC transporter ATP-binding protein [Chloroflexota bacterium]|nr:heme ABC transporter ATP-binding protein [Chloroflexota bacterium]MDE2930218.1 heme ABC transporter ATP-binding protein [Chloroflexota bacterium]